MAHLLIGTGEGLFALAGGEPRPEASFEAREVTALAVREGAAWAVAGHDAILRREPDGTWTDVARSEAFEIGRASCRERV